MALWTLTNGSVASTTCGWHTRLCPIGGFNTAWVCYGRLLGGSQHWPVCTASWLGCGDVWPTVQSRCFRGLCIASREQHQLSWAPSQESLVINFRFYFRCVCHIHGRFVVHAPYQMGLAVWSDTWVAITNISHIIEQPAGLGLTVVAVQY